MVNFSSENIMLAQIYAGVVINEFFVIMCDLKVFFIKNFSGYFDIIFDVFPGGG